MQAAIHDADHVAAGAQLQQHQVLREAPVGPDVRGKELDNVGMRAQQALRGREAKRRVGGWG